MDFDALRDRFRCWSDGWAFWSDVIWFGIKQAGGLWIIAGLYALVAIRLGRSFWIFLVALVERLPVEVLTILGIGLFVSFIQWSLRLEYFIEQKRKPDGEEETADDQHDL